MQPQSELSVQVLEPLIRALATPTGITATEVTALCTALGYAPAVDSKNLIPDAITTTLKGLGLEVTKKESSTPIYRLADDIQLLSSDLFDSVFDSLSDLLGAKRTQAEVYFTLGSTNTRARDVLEKEAIDAVLCTTEHQSSGRGQHGRKWLGPLGRNIYLSVGAKLPLASLSRPGLSLAVAVEASRVLESCSVSEVRLKWPNDLMLPSPLQDAPQTTVYGKLGGILVESTSSRDQCLIVVGIGINVSLTPETAPQDIHWADLSSIANLKRDLVAQKLATSILKVLLNQTDAPDWCQAWNARHLYFGQPVIVQTQQGQVMHGVAGEARQDGTLQLHTEDGTTHLHHGRVSLRPLKGNTQTLPNLPPLPKNDPEHNST